MYVLRVVLNMRNSIILFTVDTLISYPKIFQTNNELTNTNLRVLNKHFKVHGKI